MSIDDGVGIVTFGENVRDKTLDLLTTQGMFDYIDSSWQKSSDIIGTKTLSDDNGKEEDYLTFKENTILRIVDKDKTYYVPLDEAYKFDDKPNAKAAIFVDNKKSNSGSQPDKDLINRLRNFYQGKGLDLKVEHIVTAKVKEDGPGGGGVNNVINQEGVIKGSGNDKFYSLSSIETTLVVPVGLPLVESKIKGQGSNYVELASCGGNQDGLFNSVINSINGKKQFKDKEFKRIILRQKLPSLKDRYTQVADAIGGQLKTQNKTRLYQLNSIKDINYVLGIAEYLRKQDNPYVIFAYTSSTYSVGEKIEDEYQRWLWTAAILSFLQNNTTLTCNKEELANITKRKVDDCEQIAETLRHFQVKEAYITDAENGAYGFDGTLASHEKNLPFPLGWLVDDNGAGDGAVAVMTLLMALRLSGSKDLNTKKILEYMNLAGQVSIHGKGPTGLIPTIQNMEGYKRICNNYVTIQKRILNDLNNKVR